MEKIVFVLKRTPTGVAFGHLVFNGCVRVASVPSVRKPWAEQGHCREAPKVFLMRPAYFSLVYFNPQRATTQPMNTYPPCAGSPQPRAMS